MTDSGKRWMWGLVGAVAGAGLAYWWLTRRQQQAMLPASVATVEPQMLPPQTGYESTGMVGQLEAPAALPAPPQEAPPEENFEITDEFDNGEGEF